MDIYLIIVIVLIAFAISDLIVGVSNDAVNFLNSAIGSKVAPMHVIMIIASVGVIIGATFSSGLMEVARSGIFHPGEFTFSEIMVIFLAVMVTDIILLDLFNTFGLPTSTTVSIVFELLGSAVAVSIIKIYASSESLAELGRYINSAKALAIISGILLSVIIAFTIGAIVQYVARLIFTFSYEKTLKYYGSIFGGLAITTITFFMIIKGAKGASFITEGMAQWLETHTFHILVYGFIVWTALLQLLYWLFNVSIPKVIVLFGTFALAFAFAGNDLVNFIGVPLAGFESYKSFISTPGASPDTFFMGSLSHPIQTNTIYLLSAGIVMVITLWFSKKARSVVATSVDLSRQNTGEERFGASPLSRTIVRSSIALSKTFSGIIPDLIKSRIDKRFQIPKSVKKSGQSKDAASFDVIRASVNLVVAAALIALGTSLKLPLSTTYVTFMVAMGTSLADRAWGRDSAVYRVQGVFSVIGGWFLTAIVAFTVSFIIALIIYWGDIYAIVIVIMLVIFLIFRTYKAYKAKESEKKAEAAENEIDEITSASYVFEKCIKHTVSTLEKVPLFYEKLITGLSTEDRLLLKDLKKDIRKFNKKTKRIKDNVSNTVVSLQIDQIDTGHYYVQSVDYLREIAHCLNYMVNPAYEHIDNNHTGLDEFQTEEINTILQKLNVLYQDIISKIKTKKYSDLEQIIHKQQELLQMIAEYRKNQVLRLKEKELHTRTSLLYFDLLAETKNLLLYSVNLLKSQRDFISEISRK
ncbi:MAG TPA: inorganic phosphate transporter [Bacteroidales bacterium]|nr:inorganic phosphate transporter [Bacteroidales bacterium]